MKMRIIFKSGVEVTTEVNEFTIGRSRLTGALEELSWKYNTDTEVIMKYVDPSEVVCVLRITDDNDQDAEAAGSAESTPALETTIGVANDD